MNEGSSVSRASPLASAQRSSRLVNGTRLHPPPNLAEYSDDDPYNADDIPESDEAQQQLIDDNGSYAMMDDEGPAQSDDSIPPVPRASASKKTKGKQKAVVDAPVSVSPIVPTQKGKRGRPKKQVASQDVDDQDEPRPAKRSKQAAAPKSPVAKKGKGPSKVTKPQTTRKAQLASITEDDASSPQIKPRPPIPRSNRGLYIYRRETPSEVAGYKQTRSGRTSIKPLSWWAGERVEYDDTTIKDGNRNILVHQIKEVVRADEVEPRHRAKSAKTTTKSKSKSKKSTHDASIDEDPDFVDTDLMEAWEFEPGRIDGFLRDWNPADPSGQESQESQQLIAYAAAAINTRQVKNATFGFAKTMTMPFFGAGVVDLPPGAVKKVKNTRRMHMVFFLHYGRVEAMVNDNTFRIGQGGQWMVPRGAY